MAISNDSHFLSANHVMDYSLLVAVDEQREQLILGIVDYMRTYTFDKKLESWVRGHLFMRTLITKELLTFLRLFLLVLAVEIAASA